ncbi:MAG: phosphate acyltransferase PlsX [Acidobacteriota bacterium]|nr:phosphate acyltransferase PlsX [Acidobacteriota bacterium]MDE3169967.1 phosphate acyltransferase PlsX [Acidobacteriota bacterium]
MQTIALDAMGGDHAPRAEVEGAILAAREYGVAVQLVGIESTVRQELARHRHEHLPIEVIPAREVVAMTDSPSQAFRRKKDSSLHVAARLVRDGKADALVSAGNTGAVMTVSRFVIGTLPSVDRPALAWAFPNMKEKVSVMLDVGANVDSKPEHLEQFAVMGDIYYRAIWGVKRPRVALLSIGEEEVKGNELTRETAARLKQTQLNFVGNIEGRDLFRGSVDVIVCDGFIGNIALKLSEGLAEHISGMLKKAIQSSLASQIGYALSKRAFDALRRRTDYSEYGGAPLLGIRGITIIGHGRSNAHAVKNAVRVATELCRSRVNEKIEQELSAVAALPARG